MTTAPGRLETAGAAPAMPSAATLTIVDTTLREGEQFIAAHFTTEERLTLACQLDAFGVDVIELPSPRISPQTAADVERIVALDLRARVVAHVRCVTQDVEAALATGVDGIHLFYGTSPHLLAHSHGHSLAHVAREAKQQVQRIRAAGRYVRFSAEDAFRTVLADLLPVFDAVVEAGVQRIGLPDTVGVATPWQVAERIAALHARYPDTGIEFHGHNDTGCAVANALAALEAGADCVDVTVLGIGERTGITSLSGLVAALYPQRRALLNRYDLRRLPALDRFVADILGIPIPFNSPITSESAFAHRAGVHTNAVLRAPSSYEVLDPEIFGLTRRIDTTSRLTGWHALATRAAELGLRLDDADGRKLASHVKELADRQPLTQGEVDDVIRSFALATAQTRDTIG
ncbi:MAG: LeuA family protein [Ktedonobacterales bacterium]